MCESNRYIWDQYPKLGLKRDCHQLAEYQFQSEEQDFKFFVVSLLWQVV